MSYQKIFIDEQSCMTLCKKVKKKTRIHEIKDHYPKNLFYTLSCSLTKNCFLARLGRKRVRGREEYFLLQIIKLCGQVKGSILSFQFQTYVDELICLILEYVNNSYEIPCVVDNLMANHEIIML